MAYFWICLFAAICGFSTSYGLTPAWAGWVFFGLFTIGSSIYEMIRIININKINLPKLAKLEKHLIEGVSKGTITTLRTPPWKCVKCGQHTVDTFKFPKD